MDDYCFNALAQSCMPETVSVTETGFSLVGLKQYPPTQAPSSPQSQHVPLFFTPCNLNVLSVCPANPSYYLQPLHSNPQTMWRFFFFPISIPLPSPNLSAWLSIVFFLFCFFFVFLNPFSLSVSLPPFPVCTFPHCEEELSTRPVFSLPGLHCVCQTHRLYP